MLVNYVFLDETVAFLVRRMEAKTGIEISYASMKGDLIGGSFAFTGLHVRQNSSEAVRYDIHVDQASTRFSFWSVIRGRKHLEMLEIDGVRGSFARLKAQSAETPQSNDGTVIIRIRLGAPEDSPTIAHLSISRAALQVEDLGRDVSVTYPLTIHTLVAEPCRLSLLWFDLLFRANIEASFGDAPVHVINRREADERLTRWSAEGLDATVLASLVGGPFALFTSGTIDLTAEDTWTLQREAEISMDWSLRLHDVNASVPPDTPAWLRPPARVFVDRVNARRDPWDLGFTLTLRESQFVGAATLDAQAIWSGVLQAFLKQTLDLDDDTINSLKNRAQTGLSKFQEFIQKRDRRRQAESRPTPPTSP